MPERRYSEAEVTAIFKQATEEQQSGRRLLSAAEGMTLAELQEIGRDVGVPAELVAQAAGALDQAGPAAGQRFLGLPIGVGRTVDLDRRLSEAEWELLVVDLRETFNARGTVSASGALRQWTNGNLQAFLEPTPTGHRLRLRTVKGGSRELMAIGAAVSGSAVAMMIVAAVTGRLADAVTVLAPMALLAAATAGFGALQLPRWAGNRGRQMEGVASRLALAINAANSLPPDSSGRSPS